MEDRGAAQGGVKGQAGEEALEGMGAAGSEVVAKAVAADVLHALLVRDGRDGSGGEIAAQLLVEEDKICEAPADCSGFAGKGGKGALSMISDMFPDTEWRCRDIRGW